MKKIGFIDYYLDEWHANNYPDFIKKLSDGRYEVCYAYGKIDSPIGGMTNEEWSKKHNIPLLDSIEEVIEKSDLLIVLSPDNPEMHEELTDLPLKSGKLVYVDKTFAPDKETAIRIFKNAEEHNTPCFSSSALRFVTELKDVDKSKIFKIYSEGPGTYEMYSIHQIEPIVMLMDCPAKRVMGLGDPEHPSLIIEFEDGRFVQMHQGFETPFKISLTNEDDNIITDYPIKSDYFNLFLSALVEFFDTGIAPVNHQQTIEVIAIREAGLKALNQPFTWFDV
ncbi:MAG: hypothetical protein E7412_00500 [Ruminococcaceae bacterium]|nr:hypothetical protein [Oscillospiraceae bacterium]